MMNEPCEMSTVHIRLNDEKGRLIRSVEIKRPAIWPKAVVWKDQFFVWACGDEYTRVIPVGVG